MPFSFGSYIELESGMGVCRAKKYDSILLVLNVVAVILDVLEVGVQALVSVLTLESTPLLFFLFLGIIDKVNISVGKLQPLPFFIRILSRSVSSPTFTRFH